MHLLKRGRLSLRGDNFTYKHTLKNASDVIFMNFAKRPIFLFLLFSICFNGVTAQNLVPNGDFEQRKKGRMNGGRSISYLQFWEDPNNGTSEYFNTGKYGNAPNTWMGYKNAYSGNGFVGICLYQKLYGLDKLFIWNYREYVQAKILQTLKRDTLYCVSIYVSLASKSKLATDAIGIYFSPERKFIYRQSRLRVDAQLQSKEREILRDTAWTQLSWIYKSDGTENYITVGNFKNDRKTNIELIITLRILR